MDDDASMDTSGDDKKDYAGTPRAPHEGAQPANVVAAKERLRRLLTAAKRSLGQQGVCLVLMGVGFSSGASADDSACNTLAQSAQAGLAARIAADNSTIHQPKSVTELTCLDGFFKGVGLDILTSGLDPTKLISSVAGKICSQVQSAWDDYTSGQCGLTVTGFNLGVNLGLGGGSFCPKLSIGGGGDPLLGASGSLGGGGLVYDGTHVQLPDGYAPVGVQ